MDLSSRCYARERVGDFSCAPVVSAVSAGMRLDGTLGRSLGDSAPLPPLTPLLRIRPDLLSDRGRSAAASPP